MPLGDVDWPKIIIYRGYKNFQKKYFQRELPTKLREVTCADYQVLHSVIENVVQEHVSLKQRAVRGNKMPRVKADMRKVFMKKTRLMRRANKIGKKEYLKRYKQQRNTIVSMNSKSK